MTGPTRQQHGQQLSSVMVRVPTELHEWLRWYAQSQNPPISQAMAIARAIETLRTQHQTTVPARESSIGRH